MKRRILTILAGLLLSLTALAQEIPCAFEPAERIVAIGDVHGAYDRFVANLQATGLVDRKLRWTGGRTHLVQTGDVVDRGPDSRKVMELLMELEPQAEAAGGRVHALIGNHEFWNAVGQLGYVSEGEFEAFDGPRDRALRKAHGSQAARPGFFALREAFSAEGQYGQWIRRHNAAVRIGDFVFVHGGITPEVAKLGLPELNRRIRVDLDAAGDEWQQTLASSDDGPLMSRRYSVEEWTPEDEKRLGPELQEVLDMLGAQTMVIGHTLTFGLVEPRFEGRAVLIDTGMLDIYLGGHQAALLIEGNRLYGVYPKGRVELPASLAGDAGARYIEAAVAAAPRDDALKQRLAGVRMRQGRVKEAAKLYEKVGVLDPRRGLPYSWRKEAAECFEALGRDRRAKELYTLYLQAFGIQAERMGPSGVPLLHRFARECLRLGLLKQEALAAARKATRAYPGNLSFKVTLARAYLENGRAEGAVQILRGVLQQRGDDFETQFLLGRAYATLDEREKALEAFRAALQHQPGNRQVEEAIAKLTSKIQ